MSLYADLKQRLIQQRQDTYNSVSEKHQALQRRDIETVDTIDILAFIDEICEAGKYILDGWQHGRLHDLRQYWHFVIFYRTDEFPDTRRIMIFENGWESVEYNAVEIERRLSQNQ